MRLIGGELCGIITANKITSLFTSVTSLSEVFYDDLCLLQNYSLTIGTTSRAWEAHFVVVSPYSKVMVCY